MKLSINGVLLSLCGILALIEADGYVKIKWISYWNQHGRTPGGKYCDNGIFGGRTSKCDLKFSFKLDGKNSGSGPSWPVLKSHTYFNMDYVKFQSYFGRNSNPFKLPFKTWHGRLNLEVQAHDRDTFNNDDHVDTLRKTLYVNPNNVTRKITLSSSVHGHMARLIFTYKVACNQFYYGNLCMKYCKPADNNYGHFTCDSFGNRRCLAGWRNPEKGCLTKTTPCDTITCKNGGICLAHLNKPICNCTSGYEGPLCQNAIITSTATATIMLQTTQEIKRFTTSQFNNHGRRNGDTSTAKVTARNSLNKATTNDPLANRKETSSQGITKDQFTSPNTSNTSNVYAFKVEAQVDRDAAKSEEKKVAGIHPAIFTIPLFLIILLLIGALYHQRQRLHKAFSIMKLSNTSGGNGTEVSNIYTEGLIDPNCEGRVRFVSNNTYNDDPSILPKKPEDGSVYGSISSKSDTDEEEMMEEGLYSMPRDPRRHRYEKNDNLTPPSLPPRDNYMPVSQTVILPNHMEGDKV